MIKFKKFIKVAQWCFSPLAVACILYFGWQSRELLFDVLNGVYVHFFLLAITFWVMAHSLLPFLAVYVLGSFGDAVSYKQALSVYASNLPARYIPGGVWHTVGRVMGYHKLGVGPKPLAVFIFLENMLAISLAMLIGGIALFVYRDAGDWGVVGLMSAIAGVSGVFLAPVFFRLRILNGGVKIKNRNYIASVVIVMANCCVTATAFVFYLLALPGVVQLESLVEIAGSYLFSWGVGYIAFFAPQGIGVFEVMMSELLTTAIPASGFVALVAGFRVVVFMADILVWLACHLMLGKKV